MVATKIESHDYHTKDAAPPLGKMHTIIVEKDQATSSLGLAGYLPHVQQHFMRPNAWIYYTDLLLSCAAGNALIALATLSEPFSPTQIGAIFLAAIFIFRASIFIHEAYHVGKQMKRFRLAYNLLFGFLHKFPYYCYTPHYYHHSPKHYGTIQDPEYDTLGHSSAFYNLVAPLFLMIPIPFFLAIRWGILPLFLPFIGEKARLAIYKRASTLVMNVKYERPLPTAEERKQWYQEDAGCFLYSALTAVLIIHGTLPWQVLPVWFATAYVAMVLNAYRAMISHRYFSGFENTTHKQMIIDSGTYAGHRFSVLTSAWLYPLGLRYHALHHMFPQIPYHRMGKAHRWLMETLPENHPYRLTISHTYGEAVNALLKRRF